MSTRFGGWLVAAAAAVVILGASIAPFLIPAVVRFEQDRAGVAALTGYSAAELDAITGTLLGDLVLWRGDFEVDEQVPVDGSRGGQVLGAAEQAHMREVRGVFTGFWLLVAAGVIGLALAFRLARVPESKAALWRSVAGGARALAVVIAVVGVFAVFAFEAAFEVFHRLFFSSGTYTFDPATDRLVQLFPQQFWSEISIAVGVLVLAVSILTALVAGRRARRAGARPMRGLATSQVPA